MNIGYFFNDDNANIDWLRAALFKSIYIYTYIYVHTSAVRVNDLTRPRISKKTGNQKEICLSIKVNILVVRMIFDSQNFGWSLDQNVIIHPYTFSLFRNALLLSINHFFSTKLYTHDTHFSFGSNRWAGGALVVAWYYADD